MRKILRIAAIAYIAYLAIALIIITPALNILPHRYVNDTYGRQLTTDWVLFNPFKVSLDVSQAQLSEPDGERFASFSEASVNLSLASLWSEGVVLDTILLRDFYVQVIQQQEGIFNFSDLLASDATEAVEQPEETGTFGITINDLDIQSETIVLADNTREKPYSSSWNGLKIHVLGLSTVVAEGRPYNIQVEGEAGGVVSWEGTVSIPDAHSEGRLELSNLNLRTFWSFAEPWLQFELKDGRLSAEGLYQVDWGDVLRYQVTRGQVALTALDIQPKAPDALPETSLALNALKISNIAVYSEGHKASVDTIELDGLAIATWMENNAVSLQQLFAVTLPETTAAEPEEEAPDDTPWTATLNKFSLDNSSVRWRSEFTDPAVLNIEPIAATLEQLSWPLAGTTQLSLSLAANEQLRIAVQGGLALDTGDGTIGYQLQQLPLSWFNPNLPEQLKATLTDGLLQLEGQVELGEFAPLTVDMDAAIADFKFRPDDADVDFMSWHTLRFHDLGVDMTEHSVLLEKLEIDGYKGRIHIGKDGSLNTSAVWTADTGETAEPTNAEPAMEETVAEPTAEPAAQPAWSFRIPVVLISDTEIDFMDESLPIPFRTVVADLNGEILGISSEPGDAATVDIKGAVDDYAPVTLAGSISPSDKPALDLKLSFDGIDMSRLTPYSGTYAGYQIDQGSLTVKLAYSLADDHLDGSNDIVIDQLKLGDKIDSEQAVDLPLELALSILTDSNGVIDMKVPVSGDVDDPGFQLGGVIAKAFMNVILKAVTAPFSLLAGLVGSDEDLQRLTFAAGSFELDEVNQKKLDQLATALNQRPGLSVVSTGRLNLDADRERLQKNTLKAQLIEGGLSTEELDSKGPAWEKAIGKRYKALPDATDAEAQPTAREQYRILAQGIEVPDEQLLTLAQQRSEAVLRYLVDVAAITEERVKVGTSGLDDEAHVFSGVELGI